MCAALVGGMDRRRQEYIELARKMGFDLKVFTGQERNIKGMLGELDMLILFTGKVSHMAKDQAMKYAKNNNIPVHMVHSTGISSLKKCFCTM